MDIVALQLGPDGEIAGIDQVESHFALDPGVGRILLKEEKHR